MTWVGNFKGSSFTQKCWDIIATSHRELYALENVEEKQASTGNAWVILAGVSEEKNDWANWPRDILEAANAQHWLSECFVALDVLLPHLSHDFV